MIGPFLALMAFAAPPEGLAGVWQGTIGTLPVRVCFADPDPIAFGSYYYLQHRRLIPLESEEGSVTAFRENDVRDSNNAAWLVEEVHGRSLSGRWTQGRRTLPVRLTRIAAAQAEQGPCTSLLFHQQRLAGVESRSAPVAANGAHYRRIELHHDGQFDASVETFALDRDQPGSRQVDSLLAQSLQGDPPEWFECVSAALQYFPNEGSFHQNIQPLLISRSWLSVVEQYDDYCGGNHPNAGSRYRLFDLANGTEVELLDWFGPTAVEREGMESGERISTLKPEFRAVVLAGWRAESPECEEAIRDQTFWNAGVTRQGFVFVPSLPHVIQACGETFTLDFDKAGPWLTREGAASLRSILTGSTP